MRFASPQPRVLPGLAWWLAVWQMLDWHLGMAEGGDGQQRARLSPANAMSLARFWLVPTVPALARSSTGLPAAIVIAGATDWLDGALARRRARTRLGRDLDTTADLAFVATAALSARATGGITRLGFDALAGRYSIRVALALGAVFGRARRPGIRARPWGALLRTAGLAIGAVGLRRSGTAVLLFAVSSRRAPQPRIDRRHSAREAALALRRPVRTTLSSRHRIIASPPDASSRELSPRRSGTSALVGRASPP